MTDLVSLLLVAGVYVIGVLTGSYARVPPRDHFAAAALTAWLPMWREPGVELSSIARDCFQVADAMMKARGDG